LAATHPYSIGLISWHGLALNAIVIKDLTQENGDDGLVAATVVYNILAENLDLAEAPAKWAVFAKPYQMRTTWRFLGSGSGKQALPAPSSAIPVDVIRQLEEISPT
jgi:hypothetical protein